MATAIVTAGAGARGAYEAGVLSRVLPKLIDEEREAEIVLVGTSAGAINAAIAAGAANESAAAIADRLLAAWRTLDVSSVFTLDRAALPAYAAQAIGFSRKHACALFDTTPLRGTVTDGGHVDWATLSAKFETGWLKAAGIVATEVESGKSIVFVEGLGTNLPRANQARDIEYRRAVLAPDHVLASAAIPVLFPSVNVLGSNWFVDGGVRLNTPIAPAIELLEKVAPGRNNRVVVVSTEPDPNQVPKRSSRPVVSRRPDILGEGIAIIYANLVDRVAEDVQSLRRVNALVEASQKKRVPDVRTAGHSFQVLDHCYFGPPWRGHLAKKAGEIFGAKRRWPLSTFSVISRLIGNEGPTHDELLSFLFFEPKFLSALIEMGQKDADSLMLGGTLPWKTTG
jgi:NTE family protein